MYNFSDNQIFLQLYQNFLPQYYKKQLFQFYYEELQKFFVQLLGSLYILPKIPVLSCIIDKI